MYDALNHGALEPESLRRSLASLSLPRAGQGGSCSRSMSAPRCARTLHPAQTGCFATSTAAGRGQAQSIPGWPYSFIAAIEPGLDVVDRATRRDPPRSGRGRHRADRRAAARSTSESTETAEPTETTAEPTETTAEPTASEESNSDAERGADATTGAPENSPSSDAGNLDATSPVTPAPTRAPSGG
jgi:hypothetical protein